MSRKKTKKTTRINSNTILEEGDKIEFRNSKGETVAGRVLAIENDTGSFYDELIWVVSDADCDVDYHITGKQVTSHTPTDDFSISFTIRDEYRRPNR